MDGKKRMRITAIAVCLSALLAFALTGCATSEAISSGSGFEAIMHALKCDLIGEDDQNCVQLQLTLPVRDGFTPVKSQSAYASLKNETMKEAYRQVESAIYRISDVRAENGCYELQYARLGSSLEFDQIYIVKEAVLADHPEAFWVMSGYTVRNNFHDGNYLVLYSKYSAAELNAMFEELRNEIIPILSKIPDDASELERETVIHDAIVDEVSYDFEAAQKDDSSHDAFNVYGALVGKKAVCTGYAGAVKMLLNLVGIECRTAVGMSKNTGHMGNQGSIDGDWYNLDVTWDDSTTDSDIQYSRYSYFNITDERLARNHKTGSDYSEMKCEYTEDEVYVTTELYNFDLEECTSVKCNYYEMNALQFSAMTDTEVNAITQKFISSAQKRESVIYILFDSSINGEEAEIWLSKNTGGRHSALGRSLSACNKSGRAPKLDNCKLIRMSSGKDDVWDNLYAVRLVYA